MMTMLFLVVSLGAAAVPSGTHELGRDPAKEPRAISPSFPRASFQALWLRPSLLYHGILGFLNLYTTGAKTSGKKEVSHSFSIPAFPIMLIVTELGFLAKQS